MARSKKGPEKLGTKKMLGNWSVLVGVLGTIAIGSITGVVALTLGAVVMTPVVAMAKLMLFLMLIIQLLFVLFGFRVMSESDQHGRSYTWALLLLSLFMLTFAWGSLMLAGIILYGAEAVLAILHLQQ